MTLPSILIVMPLPPGPWAALDPFLFSVHHDDRYPPGNAAMEPNSTLGGAISARILAEMTVGACTMEIASQVSHSILIVASRPLPSRGMVSSTIPTFLARRRVLEGEICNG